LCKFFPRHERAVDDRTQCQNATGTIVAGATSTDLQEHLDVAFVMCVKECTSDDVGGVRRGQERRTAAQYTPRRCKSVLIPFNS
jgi:hypothetical protein